ncbi:hypothetical protein EI94DRAFT_1462012, partial [Lactarius quietus]
TTHEHSEFPVPDVTLVQLNRKLEYTRLSDEVNAAEWAYGSPLGDIRQLISRWKDGYD